MSQGEVVASFVVPVHPHTVLAPDQNPGWRRLRAAFAGAANLTHSHGCCELFARLNHNRKKRLEI